MFSLLGRIFIRLYRDETGALLVEYFLLAALIALAALVGVSFLGGTARNRMNNVGTTVSTLPG